MTKPHCQTCKSTTNPLHIACHRTLSNGKKRIYYVCRLCNAQRCKQYRQTSKGKIAAKKAVATYEAKNPVRVKAWTVRQRQPKENCIMCGDPNTHRHHPDITRPDYVVSLCPAHHKEAHKQAKILQPSS